MTTKKKKHKPAHQVSIPALLELAQVQMQRSEFDEAVNSLKLAELELKKYQSSRATKKVSIPPHIVTAQAALPPLLARALFEFSFAAGDPKNRLVAIDSAVKLAPDNARYLLARGAYHLLLGEIEPARADFQATSERWPDSELASHALSILSSAVQGDFQNDSLTFTTKVASRLRPGLRDLSRGEMESAREKLNALPMLDRNPSRAEASVLATQLYYIGLLHFLARDFKSAIGDFNEALRMSQSHALHLPWCERLAPYYHRIAEEVIESNQSMAIDCWQQALVLAPEDKIAANNITVAKNNSALQSWKVGDIDRAAMLWQEVLSVKPQDEQGLRNLAVACEKLGRKKDAATHWRALTRLWRQQSKIRSGEAGFKDRLLKLERHVIDLMLETGSNAQEIGNELEAALKFDPDNHELRLMTVEHFLEMGRPKQALKHVETIEKKQGISADMLVKKAEALDMLYRSNDALKTFERALELDPSNSIARRSFVVFLGHEAAEADEDDDIDRAIGICEKQLSIDPNYEPAMTHLAVLYLNVDRSGEARQLINRLLAANPQSAQKHVSVGRIFLTVGNKKEAEKFFKKAIELEPSGICYLFIGISYWETDYRKEALKYFDRAAESEIFEILLQITATLVEDGAVKEADRYLKKAMKIDPSHPIPHLIKGIGLLSKPFFFFPSPKDFEEAARELAEAERLMTGHDRYSDMVPEVRQVRKEIEKVISSGPDSLLGGLGGFPFSPEDDFFDDEPGPFVRRKKKKRK